MTRAALVARPRASMARRLVRARTPVLAGALAAVRGRRAHGLVGRRGRAPRSRRPHGVSATTSPLRVGTLRRASGRVPHESLRGAPTALGGVVASARDRLPARPARERLATRSSTVRLRPCGAHRSVSRIQVTHAEMHELVLSAGVEPSAVHTSRSGSTSSTSRSVDAASVAPRPARARVPRGRLRRRIVPEGRRRLGRGTGAEADQGTGCARRGARRSVPRFPSSTSSSPGPARGYVRGELERLAIPYTHVLATSREELAPRVPGDRRLRRPVAPGGRPQGGAGGDGFRHPARDDPRRTGCRARGARMNGWLVDVDDAESLAEWTVGTAAAWPHTSRNRAARLPSNTPLRVSIPPGVRCSTVSWSAGPLEPPRPVRPCHPAQRMPDPSAHVPTRHAAVDLVTTLPVLALGRPRGPDRDRAVKELLVNYDDAYRLRDLAAIDYDGGRTPKHRLRATTLLRRACEPR